MRDIIAQLPHICKHKIRKNFKKIFLPAILTDFYGIFATFLLNSVIFVRLIYLDKAMICNCIVRENRV